MKDLSAVEGVNQEGREFDKVPKFGPASRGWSNRLVVSRKPECWPVALHKGEGKGCLRWPSPRSEPRGGRRSFRTRLKITDCRPDLLHIRGTDPWNYLALRRSGLSTISFSSPLASDMKTFRARFKD